MSRKQEIYVELLRHSLPMARNALSHRFIYGKKREEAFRICQLTHDLYVSILDDGFNEHDIWFLNVHAREYVSRAKDVYCIGRWSNYSGNYFLKCPLV